ncbi:MAG: c-type cytochrome [Planctomycetaceae bacterium]
MQDRIPAATKRTPKAKRWVRLLPVDFFLFASCLSLAAALQPKISRNKQAGEFPTYQKAFAAAARKLGSPSSPSGPVWIQPEALKTKEACTSCHLGINDKRFLYARLPYRRHSGHYLEDHPSKRFGCTVCHGGVADGLTFAAAGHPTPADPARRQQWKQHYLWRPPGTGGMLPLKFIAGRCAVCHSGSQPPPGAEPYTTARAVVAKKQCTSCHSFRDEPKQHIRTAVQLDGLGSKVGDSWLRDFLKNPQAWHHSADGKSAEPINGAAAMPAYAFDAAEVKTLADYLLSLKRGDIAWGTEDPARDAAAVARGRKQVASRRCQTCHDIPGMTEKGFLPIHKIGPPLARVGEKLNPGWIRQWLKDPHALRPQAAMPRFRFKPNEIEDIAAFLSSLRRKGAAPAAAGPSAAASTPDAKQAARVATKYGCVACHSIKGLDLDPPSRTDLSKVGPQVLARLAEVGMRLKTLEGAAGVFHRKPHTPRLFAAGEPVTPVLTFLAGETEVPIAKNFRRLPSKQRAPFAPTGAVAKLVKERRCLSCHSIRGTGGDVGPDLTFAGSKLNRDWLIRFLQNPTPIRPMNRARMPNLGLTPEEARQLADWIGSTLKSEEVEKSKVDLDLAFSFVGASKIKSPYGCITCHHIGKEGGRVGPELTLVGDRLKTNWIYNWIRNPQHWKPDVRMPNFKMKEEDLSAVTLYLSERKTKGK